ncbi:MAG: putative aminohydrolase SsnA [Ignavibacteriales bacterium]|nr:putative aminohydrolase SsnA [Ignavibacteriales bacterium]
MSLLLKNTRAVTLAPSSIEECDIRIDEGTIVERAARLKPKQEDEIVDLKGWIVMPGFVCSHTHLYSALSRGMPAPASPPRNFVEILKKVWWKLDEALDEEAIYYSALAGAIESVKFGTTTLIDHQASPNFISGSLDLIKHAMCQVGVRGVLCYETTDRGGKKRRDEGLAENERFLTENASNAHFRGTIGAHASFTLGDDSLARLGELAAMYDCGVHVHVAEDKADVVDSLKKHRTDIIDRLKKFGVLRKKSIVVHGVHLTKRQLAAVEKAGAWMVHNPRSNMNNAVGYAPLGWYGARAALGTDGFPADMFEESKIGYFRNAESDHRAEFSRLPVMVQNGQKLAGEFFNRPFGTLKKGSPADLVVLEYASPTPLTSRNLHGHFLFGMNSTMIQHVIVGGKWIVWNKQLVGIDEDAVMHKAAQVAKKLWSRMHGT